MKPTTVDEYIAAEPPETGAMLNDIRSIILSCVPQGTEEVISYMIPCYKYHGMLIGFGARKNGCSLYTMSTTILKEHEGELNGLKYKGSTLHFDLGKKLPAALIKKITKEKVVYNEARAQQKQIKTK